MTTKLCAALAALLLPLFALAATPAQEKAFVDAYKAAYEGRNGKALTAMLYTKGADPQALEFYKMMMSDGMGGKITSIALEPLTDADKQKAGASMPGPGGKSMKLTLRNVPLDAAPVDGTCIFTGVPAVERVLVGRAY